MRGLPGRVVVVGAGLAGARCAESLRTRGYTGEIVVVGEEPHLPYERPALSKAYLAGGKSATQVALPSTRTWEERGIEHHAGRIVVHADPVLGRVTCADSSELAFDALVIATGVRARRLRTLPDAPNALALRTLDDARRLRELLEPGGHLVVIGGGFIGTEAASTARSMGIDVTLVEGGEAPLARALGPEVGMLLANRYRQAGVDLRLGATVEGFRTGSDGRVTHVRLAGGEQVPCTAVLVGIGSQPAPPVVQGNERSERSAGIVTDHAGRTRLPGVYACGDVANWWSPSVRRYVRVEHWTSAAAQAAAVAGAIMGDDSGSDELPFFWSDQFGMRLQHVGFPLPFDHVEVTHEGGGTIATYRTASGDPIGIFAIDRPDVIAGARRQGLRSLVAGEKIREWASA